MERKPSETGSDHVSRRGFIRGSIALGGVAGAGAIPNALVAADERNAVPGPRPSLNANPETHRPVSPPPSTTMRNADIPPFVISGVIPRVSVSANLKGPRSESGIGAMMPWGGRLWFITYVAHTARTGSGTGLYYVDDSLTVRKHPASVVGTYANRFVHNETRQMIIGPHVIDADNNVRTIDELAEYRLTATMAHLHHPDERVYMLGMESHLWEVDLKTLKTKLLFELNRELGLPRGFKPHYKGGFTARDRVIVGNNTYHERDNTEGESTGGRLAEWDGRGEWRILEHTAFTDIAGTPMGSHAHAMAVGWDRASVIFNVLNRGQWKRYRLPKASHCYDQAWYTEWPRIREVETERFLMDMHGMFYEVPRQAYGGRFWGIKPICQHLRMVPDFCSWKGLLVLAGNQNTAVTGNDLVGEPQSNLWFGKTDDLWSFGKPQGWGGPWYKTQAIPERPSDPYLMTGFDQKCLHLTADSQSAVHFAIEVDFLGNGTWGVYKQIPVEAGGYAHHVFPPGFSAHWIRLTVDRPCVATAQLVYT